MIIIFIINVIITTTIKYVGYISKCFTAMTITANCNGAKFIYFCGFVRSILLFSSFSAPFPALPCLSEPSLDHPKRKYKQ